MPEPPKRARPGSSPELRAGADRPSIEVDQTVGAAKSYAASQDHVRPELARKGTLIGMGATKVPGPPPLPPALRPTAPAAAFQAPTQRAPTPATGVRIPLDETPRSDPPDHHGELAKDLAELAEYRRRERVQAESRGPGPYQPPLRSQSPVPSSTPAKVDQALGMTIRHLLAKAAPFLLAAAGIGGGVTAVAKPNADPAKTDAVLASQEAMRADVALLREQVAGMLKREAARDQYVRCLEESVDEVGEQLLPAQDRLTNASPLRAYVKRCQRLRP